MPNLKLKKFDALVESFAKIPGVGKKSALKYAYSVSLGDSFLGLNLAHSIEDAIMHLRHCVMCGAISENEICHICGDDERDGEIICVVESAKDILTIERAGSFTGKYFVFDDMQKGASLAKMIEQNGSKELIFAFTPSINSDAIMLYIEDFLHGFDLNFTKIAQGIPTGVSLENVDILSLTKALKDRQVL